jgi:xanthine dehydrogenase accessory factor
MGQASQALWAAPGDNRWGVPFSDAYCEPSILTMAHELNTFLQHLVTAPAILVSVARGQGSVPREAGAWMAVFADRVVGTVGGGHLEWLAIAQARERLGMTTEGWDSDVALGPSLGQCCGGRVQLAFEPVQSGMASLLAQRLRPHLHPVALFGGGHVGAAIVQALAPLPFEVLWVDSRDEIFPADVPPHVRTEHSDPVHQAVADLLPGCRVLIMSFSHAEDLDIVQACLQRVREQGDLPFVGLIGSQTKWATFRSRLRQRGYTDAELDHITCPIGLSGIRGKEPPVIAAGVAAQLLLGL